MNNFIIQSGGTIYNIFLDDIYYFENDLRKVNIILKNYTLTYYDTFSHLCTRVNDDFFQCHRAYIVNKTKIHKICFNDIYFYGIKKIVPITNKRKEILIEELLKY